MLRDNKDHQYNEYYCFYLCGIIHFSEYVLLNIVKVLEFLIPKDMYIYTFCGIWNLICGLLQGSIIGLYVCPLNQAYIVKPIYIFSP